MTNPGPTVKINGRVATRIRWWGAGICLLGVGWAVLIGCWPRQRLNLLLVTLDTTRADHLGCYGAAGAPTPTLDSLATQGVLFENAYTVVPLTLPSHATMFTGMTPREHGMHDNGVGKLSAALPTLADILHSRGYATGGFVASYVLNAKFGLNRGFATYDDDLSGGGYTDHNIHRRRDGQLVVDQTLKWLSRRTAQPFFCWLHLFDAHAPYQPREQVFGEQFRAQPYAAGIAYADRQIQRIVEHLHTHGLDRHTLIVIVGDHGEGLGEHAEREHGHMLYNSTLHVPLIIALPGMTKPGHRIPATVSLTDLFPTVLDCLGVSRTPAEAARSLRPALVGSTLRPRACYAETDAPYAAHRAAPQRSVISDSWKYIRSPRPELYNLDSDRGETQNLVADEPERKQALETLISQWEANSISGGTGEIQLSQAEQQALASLGYTGHSKSPADLSSRVLPDIKDRIGCHNALQDATELLKAGQPQAALAAVEKLLELTPDYLPAQLFLGEVLRNAGRPSDAEHIFRNLLQSDFEGTDAGLKLGIVLAQQERYPEALDQFQKLLQGAPESAECHLQIGIAFKNLKNYPRAFQEMTLALRLDPESPFAHYELGLLNVTLGQLEQALGDYRTALKYAPDWGAPYAEIAVILGRQNRLSEALEHSRQAVQLEPKNADFQYNLGIMYFAQGQLESASGPLAEALRLRSDHPHAAEQLERVRKALQEKRP